MFILPLAIERARFSRRCVFLGHALCDYNGPLLAPEFPSVIAPADFANWWRAVEAFIQKTPGYNYDVVLFDKMPERIGQQANPLLALATTRNASRAYRACLGKDWQSFYAEKRSSATRQRDRAKRKKLSQSGELRVITANDPEERQGALRVLFQQNSRTFARNGLASLFAQPGHSDFYLSVAAKAGALVHVSRLNVGSTCVAANLGLRFRGCYYYILTSYDDGPFRRFGPGVIHLHELMRYAISLGFSYFDFTIGDHSYKLDWADEEVKLYDHIAAARWLGLPAAAQLTLKRRAKQFLKKSPLLCQLAARCKSVLSRPQIIDTPETVCLRRDWKIVGSVLPAGSPAWQMRPPVSAIAENLGRVWKHAFRLVSRVHVLSLADQAVVSGTGFLTTLLIARWSGAEQLGVYAVGISMLGAILTCQYSLILEPYLIQRHYSQGTPAERAGASLTLSVLFSAASILVLTVVATGFLELGAGREIVVMTWAIAGALPFALTRDFARQFSFARLAFGRRPAPGYGRSFDPALDARLAGSERAPVRPERVRRFRRSKRMCGGRMAVLHARGISVSRAPRTHGAQANLGVGEMAACRANYRAGARKYHLLAVDGHRRRGSHRRVRRLHEHCGLCKSCAVRARQ